MSTIPEPASVLPEFNPFDPQFKANPHVVYAQLRRLAPVHRVQNRDGQPLWLVTRYEDIVKVLKDPRFVKSHWAVTRSKPCAYESELTPAHSWLDDDPFPGFEEEPESSADPLVDDDLFTRGAPAHTCLRTLLPSAVQLLDEHLLALDPPAHTRLRNLVNKAFTSRSTERWRPHIQVLADTLLDRVQGQGHMDLIDDYAFPLSIGVITQVLGIPTEDHALFREWSTALITYNGKRDLPTMAIMQPILEAFAAYLRRLFAAKRSHPEDDLTTQLVQAEEAGDRLSEDELIAMLMLLIVAGHETTVSMIGNGVLALLQHPDQLAQFQADPALMTTALEELLRYDGPVETSTARYPLEDVELGGVIIPHGERVLVVFTSANRDEAMFAQPDILDITRTENRHVAFGYGIHFCVGAPLGRLEVQIALSTLFRRLPTLRFAVDPATLEWRQTLLIHGLNHFPVAFEPPIASR